MKSHLLNTSDAINHRIKFRWVILICGILVFEVSLSLVSGSGFLASSNPNFNPVSSEIVVLRESLDSPMPISIQLPPKIHSGSNEPLEWKVVFKNGTSKNLKIGDPRTSCGCTGMELSSETLPSGKQTNAILRVRPTSSKSVQSATVEIFSADGDETSRWVYRLRAPLFRQMFVSPGRLHKAVLELGENSPQLITLHCLGHEGDQLPEIKSAQWKYDCSFPVRIHDAEESKELKSVVQKKTAISFDLIGETRGKFSDILLVTCSTPDGGDKVIECPVTWNVPSKYKITPRRIVMYTNNFKQTARANVSIESMNGSDFSVVLIEPMNPAVNAGIENESKNSCVINIDINPSRLTEDVIWTELIVHTDDITEPVLKVPVSIIAQFESPSTE